MMRSYCDLPPSDSVIERSIDFEQKMRRPLLILLAWCFYFASCQDLPSVYGKLSLTTQALSDIELNAIATKCYAGLHMKTCKSVVPTDDEIYGYDSHYYKITLANTAQLYCLQCCGLNPKRIDNWDIRCAVDTFTAVTSNLYGYEFRMSTQTTLGGFDYISCPLKRKACTYTVDGILISCPLTDDSHHLHGYELTLNVVSYTSNFESWRGVSSCSAISFESNIALVSGDAFTESIRMTWEPAPFQATQPVSLAFFSLFAILVLLVAVYFGRTKHCPICTKKLVLFPNRCYVCVFLGAEVPDPVMMRALEAKGRRIVYGNSKPRQTYVQTGYALYKRCGILITKCLDCLCCRRKITSVHLIEVNDDDRYKDVGGEMKTDGRDLELQSNATNTKDSPEKQYYTKAKGVYKNVSHKVADVMLITSPTPETDKAENIPHHQTGFRNILTRFTIPTAAATATAIVAPIELATRIEKSLQLKIDSMKSTVAAKKVKKFLKRAYIPDKNPRTLHFPPSTIANAIDDEYSNRKPTGLSKNKFAFKKVEAALL